jgi:hypothetical protein
LVKATWQRHFAQKAAEAYRFVDGHGAMADHGDAQLDYHDPGTGRHKRIQLSFTGKIVEPVFCDAGANASSPLAAGEAVYIDDRAAGETSAAASDGRCAPRHIISPCA